MSPSLVRKRSIEVAGIMTSVSLESAFWDVLKLIAVSKSVTLQQLVTELEQERAQANRSSHLRVYALKWALTFHDTVEAAHLRSGAPDWSGRYRGR